MDSCLSENHFHPIGLVGISYLFSALPSDDISVKNKKNVIKCVVVYMKIQTNNIYL